MTKKELIKEMLTRAVDTIYPSKDALVKRLQSKKPFTLYHGVDPTGPHLHLGHLTNLLVLKRFQQLGHKVIFLIGDFTARIGDPSDKLAVRAPLTEKEIKQNLKTFKDQAGKIISFGGSNAVKVKFNSAWLAKLSSVELIEITKHVTVQQLIQRDMFQKRIKTGKPISLHEFWYPIMQGYDSVAMGVDLEIGGTDQTFNMLIGRDLMKVYKQKEKFVLTTKLLENPKTGLKLMNKSEGGLINLDDNPNDMFGKVMALPDEAIGSVAEYCTELPMAKVRTLGKMKNKRDAKIKVAAAVVATIHSQRAAKSAEEHFINIFSKKKKPETIPEVSLGVEKLSLIELLVRTKLAKSRSEARRLIEQGGVKINDVREENPKEEIALNNTILLQVGKRHFKRVKK